MKNIIKNIHGLALTVFIAFLMTLFAPFVYAQAVHKTSDFNHMRTGFPLTGAHIQVECETCHIGGLFKGTPKDCAGCHSVGRRVAAPVKPPNHMDTSAACDTCHNNTVTFVGARFNHIAVQPKACMTCHTGIHAPGKPSGHVVTTSSCDTCHRTSSWLPAGFNHTGTFLICSSCHNNSPVKGKPAIHVPTTAECDTCHKTGFISFAGAIYDHIVNGVPVSPASCGTCHVPGTYGAKTKPSGHIPYTGNDCDSCHVGTGFISFAGSTMNHGVVSAMSCSTCHNGSYTSQGSFLGGAKAKTANHVVTTLECNACHKSFNTFLGGLFDHTTASPPVSGICQTCHNGVKALGKTNTATHNGTTASCDTCHGNGNNYTSFAGAVFNHVGVATICGTCHLGQSAGVVTKTQLHIPTSGNACDDCHKGGFSVGGFALPTMNHNSVSVTSTSCSICHGGAYTSQGKQLGGALAKPANHISTNATCSTCHHSFTTFAGAVYDHSGVLPATCGTCHIPGTSGAKTLSSRATHVPVTVAGNACDACHKAGYTSFAGATMNHAAVTATTCDTCHNGSYLSEGTQGAWAKTHIANHIPTTITGSLPCNTCHTSTTSWTSEKMNHNGSTTGCKTCHNNGTSYMGNMFKMTLGNHQGSKSTDDCSQSGCHRPLGNVGSSWSKWN